MMTTGTSSPNTDSTSVDTGVLFCYPCEMTDRHRILITGSRTWPDHQAVEDAISAHMQENGNIPYVVVHGDAVGADTMADYAAGVLRGAGWDITTEVYPADWSQGRGAGIARNQMMVDLGADVVLAFNHNNSSGTKHCMGAAQAAGLTVLEFTR